MQLNRCSVVFLIMLLAFIVQVAFSLLAQSDVVGKYHLSNNSLELRPDSTFTFRWSVCLTHRWSSGIWRMKNDTIYFKVIPVSDTVTYSDKRIKVTKLNLSENGESKHTGYPISEYKFTDPDEFVTQDAHHFPKELFFKNNKLFSIADDRTVIRKKNRMSFLKKGYPAWYTREVRKS